MRMRHGPAPIIMKTPLKHYKSWVFKSKWCTKGHCPIMLLKLYFVINTALCNTFSILCNKVLHFEKTTITCFFFFNKKCNNIADDVITIPKSILVRLFYYISLSSSSCWQDSQAWGKKTRGLGAHYVNDYIMRKTFNTKCADVLYYNFCVSITKCVFITKLSNCFVTFFTVIL